MNLGNYKAKKTIRKSPFGTGKCDREGCGKNLPHHICFSGEFKESGKQEIETKYFCCFECQKVEKAKKKYSDLRVYIGKKRKKKVASSEGAVASEKKSDTAVEKKNT